VESQTETETSIKYELGQDVQVKIDNAWMNGIVCNIEHRTGNIEIQYVNSYGALGQILVSEKSKDLKARNHHVGGRERKYEFGNPVIVKLNGTDRVPGMITQVNKKSVVVQFVDVLGNPQQKTFPDDSELIELNLQSLEEDKNSERVDFFVVCLIVVCLIFGFLRKIRSMSLPRFLKILELFYRKNLKRIIEMKLENGSNALRG
jgi:ribosomal protein L21E